MPEPKNTRIELDSGMDLDLSAMRHVLEGLGGSIPFSLLVTAYNVALEIPERAPTFKNELIGAQVHEALCMLVGFHLAINCQPHKQDRMLEDVSKIVDEAMTICLQLKAEGKLT